MFGQCMLEKPGHLGANFRSCYIPTIRVDSGVKKRRKAEGAVALDTSRIFKLENGASNKSAGI